jgi:iron complex outermembrane receptor protein
LVRIALVISLFFASARFCFGAEVRGEVVDTQTGMPLEQVQIRAGDLTVSSDVNGDFMVGANSGDSLYFTRVGYEDVVWVVGESDSVIRVEMVADMLRAEEVVVVGGLRAESLDEMSASVRVLGARSMDRDGVQHIQNVMQQVPNIHWAGGTARPRYFQMRGIGERSQYAGEGPPNFSVGFVVDGVDLSGLGTGALFDLEQVEIFRGPQSSAFGANALAGLINVESAEPSSTSERIVRFGLGGDGLLRTEGIVNAPIDDRLALRAGYQLARSNGFRENAYLDIDDSNRRRESLLRFKLRYATPGGFLLKSTLFRVEADNGYDMWSPDNNRGLVTYSDRLGRDHQTTTAFSLRMEKPMDRLLNWVAISTYAQTELDYSYDGDWGNDVYWGAEPYLFDPEVEGWRYDFYDRTQRQRTSLSQEVRLESEAFLFGVYSRMLREEDDATGYLFGGSSSDLEARFDMGHVALYGQLERPLSGNVRLMVRGRVEHSSIDYRGETNAGAQDVRYDVGGWLPGGKVSVNWKNGRGHSAYAAVARGYRAGGINQHPYLAAANRPYDPEYMLNVEGGYRLVAPRYRLDVVAFYALRDGQQVSLSSQQTPGDPNSFFYFTANAASGVNRGVEVEGQYRFSPSLSAVASLGYLRARVDPYGFDAADGQRQELGGRAPAHAPQWSLRLGSTYTHRLGLFARAAWSLTDKFYFSDSHDLQAEGYQIVNGSVGYEKGTWSLTLWGRNVLDERYAVRGFYFGLAPPDYADTLYLSYGDPRQVGLSLAARF